MANVRSYMLSAVLLRLDAADTLVRAVADRGSVPSGEAARLLLALSGGPAYVADAVLDRVVRADARLSRSGGEIVLAPAPLAAVPLDRARIAVVDLETTGLSVSRARVLEVGVVVLEGHETVEELEAGPEGLERLLALTEGAVLAGHNLRFDVSFLDRELRSTRSARTAAPVVDTLPLARRLLGRRIERVSLSALAEFFDTAERPCHRALADARATAEILLRLVEIAFGRGARTVGDLCALARPSSVSSADPIRTGR
jgi:DNA polymerase III epsilon subunit-like protein